MRKVARLLFGPGGDRLLDLVTPDTRAENELASRVREAGEWCQTTPGAGSAARQAGWLRPQPRTRPNGR